MSLLVAAAQLALLLVVGAVPCPWPAANAAALVKCVLERSPEVARAEHELAAASGRRASAGVLLPSFPELSLNLLQRTDGGASATNWEATLSQELEIAGQHGARVEAAEAQIAAASRRLALTRQEVAAAALSALVNAAVASEERALAGEIGEMAAALGAVAQGRAEAKVSAPAEADTALAEVARLARARADATRRFFEANAELALLLGYDVGQPLEIPPAPELLSELGADPSEPLPRLLEHANETRGDLAAAHAEREAASYALSVIKRSRVPNITLSGFLGRDGFGEKIVGGGVSIPLALLPSPVGPSRAGEIEELEARIGQADADIESVQRRVSLEVARAGASLEAAREARASLPRDALPRARSELGALRESLRQNQLSITQAVILQRGLVDLLLADIELRRAHALAHIELLRAAALAIPGVEP